jgi:D-alanyl-D-alanine carboxypeptidase
MNRWKTKFVKFSHGVNCGDAERIPPKQRSISRGSGVNLPWAALFASISLTGALPVLADSTDDFIHQQMTERRIPGVSLMVIRNGRPVKTAAYGLANLELRTPVTPETVFEIGSLTKQFTAAGILLLAQEDKLSVDDKLGQHLPEIPATWTNVSLRHLLTHTSGIKSYTGLNGFELTKHQTREQFIRQLSPQALEFAPGEKYKYCNSGYNLLGYVIEAVSARSYWESMAENVFRPLGMSSTTDRNPRTVLPNRASGYEQTTNYAYINRDYDLTDVFSAGAMVSTVGDLAKWDAALDSGSLLTVKSKELWWTPNSLNDGTTTDYGFGWRMGGSAGRKTVGHSGSTSGFSASLLRFPEPKLTVIVLTNTDEQIASRLAETVASLYLGGKP